MQIEADLVRLERVYAEKAALLRANVLTANTEEYHRLREAEGNTKRDLDFAQAELNSHRRSHHRDANKQAGAR
jgi:hypothetical protein